MKLKGAIKLFGTIGILFISTISFSQSKADADKLFLEKKYNAARIAYQKLYDKDKNNIEINYKIVLCYFNTLGYKLLAKPYLEFLITQPQSDKQVIFYLAKIYQLEQKFDLAITTYNKFIAEASSKLTDKAYREIETCRNAIVAIKQPLNVTIENLGKDINSDQDDFFPHVTEDESVLAFSSNRQGTTNNIITPDLLPNTDILLSETKASKWQKPTNAGKTINTMYNEICNSLSSNGDVLITRVEKSFEDGNLCYTSLKDKKAKTELFQAPINTASIEKSAYMTTDSRIIIFSSNRLGGYGGLDLWMCVKLPSGEWGTPTNLGPTINTRFNEDFPYSPDNLKTFFFASEGFNSIGGFDIFKSAFDEINNKWEGPKNIGYPINTTDDNLTISFSANKTHAYSSYAKTDGFGGLDLYKITFNQVQHDKTLVRGKIVLPQGAKSDITATTVDIFTKKKQKLIDTYKVQFNGNFFAILPPGDYIININLEGFLPISEEVQILDKLDFKENIDRTFSLVKK